MKPAAVLALRLGGAFAAAVPLLAPTAIAQEKEQQEETTATISARVTSVIDGSGAVIDRGRVDGLVAGDRVLFEARGGQREIGTIVELENRTATVRPQDEAYRPANGTAVTIVVPRSRFARPAPKPDKVPVPVPKADDGEPAPTGGKPKRWTREDDDWTPDMPLLAKVEAVDPTSRATSFRGRMYTSWNRIVDSEDGRGDSFLRAGGALFGENVFGQGGVVHFDGEWNARRTQLIDGLVNDVANEDERTFRLDRLSYTLGGTRQRPNRLRFGRFLHQDMPEFGVLDGVSWGARRDRGDRYGVSVGFLPEPNKDQQSLEDFQFAGWYRWVADEREHFALTGGTQKTFHNSTRDRDLFIGKLEYTPPKGWNVFGSLWVDLYSVGDNVKSSGPEPTYAILDFRRNFESGHGVDIEYRHQKYPELLREDFPPVDNDQIDDAVVDRLSFTTWKWNDPNAAALDRRRSWVRLAAWADEADSGGDAEVGLDVYDMFTSNARATFAAFINEGRFTSHWGGRVSYGVYGLRRSWSALYEFRQNRIEGFSGDNNDSPIHRVRGSYEFFRTSGLSASFSAEYRAQDLENQVLIGLFLQHSF